MGTLMILEIFKFELLYRKKSPETYIFFVFLFLFSLVGVDFFNEGIDLGLVKKNSPAVIANTMAILAGLSMMVTSIVMGMAIIRDFEYKMESLMFINPISKQEYLAGRFLGAFTVVLFIFSGMLLGMMASQFMPWHDPAKLLPFDYWVYLQPFLNIVLPTLFFGAAIFFVTAALSRKLIVVYTQGIFFFIIFNLFLLFRVFETHVQYRI